MKRRRILLPGTLAVVMTVLWLGWPSEPAEPVYQGKHLSQLLEEALGSGDNQRRTDAQNAIKAIGTNAISYLLSEFTRPFSKWPSGFNRWTSTSTKHDWSSDDWRLHKTAFGLHLLGPDLAPALPTLAKLLDDTNLCGSASWVMSGAGKLAIPFFVKASSSTNTTTVEAALVGLEALAKNTEAAIPPLIQLLSETNLWVQLGSLNSLEWAGRRPDVTVQLLIARLTYPDKESRQFAASVLGHMGAVAKPAVTNLLALMADPNPWVASRASNAVYQIDPAALTPRRP